ncbi:MAG: hypothetical protein FWH05_08075 [Oscillospiraceae bacterium]|nr:hypothetical protein [Oscillospiraceae bacterium]
MKKTISILLTAYILTGCFAQPVREPLQSENRYVTEDTREKIEEIPREVEHDFSALELLGYYIDEKERVMIKGDWKIECEADIYRKYIFGTWQGLSWANENDYLIIDDSQHNNCTNWLNGGHYQKENTIIFVSHGTATTGIFWLNIDNPGVMYCAEVSATHVDDAGVEYYTGYDINNFQNFNINILTKTDLPINQPENNFLSTLRLYEFSDYYEIERNLLFNIEYTSQAGIRFSKGQFVQTPTYLVSEESEKLVFRSTLINPYYENGNIDIIYTIEKENDSWVRELEILTEAGASPKSATGGSPAEITYTEYEKDLVGFSVVAYLIETTFVIFVVEGTEYEPETSTFTIELYSKQKNLRVKAQVVEPVFENRKLIAIKSPVTLSHWNDDEGMYVNGIPKLHEENIHSEQYDSDKKALTVSTALGMVNSRTYRLFSLERLEYEPDTSLWTIYASSFHDNELVKLQVPEAKLEDDGELVTFGSTSVSFWDEERQEYVLSHY